MLPFFPSACDSVSILAERTVAEPSSLPLFFRRLVVDPRRVAAGVFLLPVCSASVRSDDGNAFSFLSVDVASSRAESTSPKHRLFLSFAPCSTPQTFAKQALKRVLGRTSCVRCYASAT